MGDRSKIEWTDASWNPIRAHQGARGEGHEGIRCVEDLKGFEL